MNPSNGAPGLTCAEGTGAGEGEERVASWQYQRRVQRPNAETGPLLPNCRTTPRLFLGLAPVLPRSIQMIITRVLEVLEPPSWASNNPSSFVKQLAVFPLPGEIRDFVVYWPQSGVEAKEGLCLRSLEKAYSRGWQTKGTVIQGAFLFLGRLFSRSIRICLSSVPFHSSCPPWNQPSGLWQ